MNVCDLGVLGNAVRWPTYLGLFGSYALREGFNERL